MSLIANAEPLSVIIARLQFETAHGDTNLNFQRRVLWSDETKMGVFCHIDKWHIWREKGGNLKPQSTTSIMKCDSIVLLGCFTAVRTGELHKRKGIMKYENH